MKRVACVLAVLLAAACAVGVQTGTDAGQGAPDSSSPSDGGAGGADCGTLVGPDVPASCSGCGTTHVCQANGCYNGYLCDTAVSKCHAPVPGC